MEKPWSYKIAERKMVHGKQWWYKNFTYFNAENILNINDD